MSFDADRMRGQSVGIYPVNNSAPEPIIVAYCDLDPATRPCRYSADQRIRGRLMSVPPAKAQVLLGYLYENGYGAPQAYDAAVELYIEAAIRGNPFGQSMLGLMYDKGHGVSRDVVLVYKGLNPAAAHAPRRERVYFLRL